MNTQTRTSLSLPLFIALALVSGCAASQKLSVNTMPAGARVSLTKISDRVVSGGVVLVHASGPAGQISEGPYELGTSPVQAEFPLEQSEGNAAMPFAHIKVSKKIRSGIVRAQLGCKVVERLVYFTGAPLVINLVMDNGQQGPLVSDAECQQLERDLDR